MRLFFALELPRETKETLVAWQEKLRRSGRASWKWVEAENLHLTVRFLGEVPEERLEEVVAAGREAARECPSFPLSLGGLGFFPPQGPVRVAWVGVGEQKELFELREKLEEALRLRGFPPEEREFRPHLTLARAREPVSRKLLPDPSPGEGGISIRGGGSFWARELVLFRSLLRPTGPEYRRLASFEFLPAAPSGPAT